MGYVAERKTIDTPTLRKAMLYGTVTASFCVEGFSIEGLSGRTRTDIDKRFDELMTIVTV